MQIYIKKITMLLTPNEIEIGLKIVLNWTLIDHALEKKFVFKNFKETMLFINKIAIVAEEQKHHPEWTNVYNRLTIRLSTHDFGGITQKDFDLARAIDSIK